MRDFEHKPNIVSFRLKWIRFGSKFHELHGLELVNKISKRKLKRLKNVSGQETEKQRLWKKRRVSQIQLKETLANGVSHLKENIEKGKKKYLEMHKASTIPLKARIYWQTHRDKLFFFFNNNNQNSSLFSKCFTHSQTQKHVKSFFLSLFFFS